MRAGIDLDGVVHDWTRQVRGLIQGRFGHDPGMATHWDYFKERLPADQWKWIWNEGVQLGLFRGGAIPGAMPAIRQIQKTQDIVIITARPKTAIKDTLDWIAHHDIEAMEVHILPPGADKSGIVCDWYVDDNAENVANYLAAGRDRVYVFDQPWNWPEATRKPSAGIRVFGWNDLLTRVMT